MKELHDGVHATCSICRVSPEKSGAALLRRLVDEIWNAGNIDLADELFSTSYVNHGGLIPDLVKGPEGIKFSVALYRAAFPGLCIRIDSLSSSHGSVQMHWTAHGSAVDHGNGTTSALNGELALSGSMRSSVVAGQIVETWTSWDSTVALQALGSLVFSPRDDT